MQMTPEVIAALQTLKDAAENDFELHRISVLEQDLTNPPKPEIVDDNHQKFLGINFRKRKNKHYFTPDMSIYRLVWTYYYGELPPNTLIHHVDHDPNNNDISNLIPMSPRAHRQHHGKDNPPRVISTFQCAICGKDFQTSKHSPAKCCSSECSHKLPYFNKTGKTTATRTRKCVICGKEFIVSTAHNSSGSKNKLTCSDECLSKLRSLNHKPKTIRTKTCEICGKTFELNPHHLQTRTCSNDCAKKLRSKH